MQMYSCPVNFRAFSYSDASFHCTPADASSSLPVADPALEASLVHELSDILRAAPNQRMSMNDIKVRFKGRLRGQAGGFEALRKAVKTVGRSDKGPDGTVFLVLK